MAVKVPNRVSVSPHDSLKAALITARDLISDESKWVQGKAQDGERVCASQACWMADHMKSGQMQNALREKAGMWVSLFNDSHTHQEVLNLFDSTIDNLPDN